MNDHVGTPAFMAPEIQQKKSYVGWAVDIWSLGVLLYTLVTGSVPFKTPCGTEELIKRRASNSLEIDFPENLKLSTQIKDLVSSCLKINPGKRPTAIAIL